MNGTNTLRTARLELVAATLEHILAELAGRDALAALLSAEVPASWPPGEYDADALEFFRSRLAESPDAAGWYGWYALAQEAGEARPTLVAGAGYLGPPADATVEVGYSVIPEARGKGYATEAVRALVARAFALPEVTRVIAHTDDTNLASSAVLVRNGFERSGPGETPGSSRYERSRDGKGA